MSAPPPAGTTLQRSKRKAAEKVPPAAVSLQEPPRPPPQTSAEKIDRIKKAPLSKKKKQSAPEEPPKGGSFDGVDEEDEEEVSEDARVVEMPVVIPKQRMGVPARTFKEKRNAEDDEDDDACFLGDPVPEEEARARWPHRYQKSDGKEASITQQEDNILMKAKCHYLQARVDGRVYHLNDDTYVKAGEGTPHYIGRIVEFFETFDHEFYFTAQWFFRAEDTVLKEHVCDHDARRVFLSDEKNDNALNCIVEKVRILCIPPKVGLPVAEKEILGFDLYYDMTFSVAYSSFSCVPSDVWMGAGGTSSTITTCIPSDVSDGSSAPMVTVDKSDPDSEGSTSGHKSELALLDLFSGCGAMSTGLCLGANLAGVNLKTHWAVDMNSYACKSLKFNHHETEVRNEKAEDFLAVIREWKMLCQKYGMENESSTSMDDSDDEGELEEQSKLPKGEFEVGKIVGICHGKTENLDEVGLKFKVRWKGYGPSEDTWEPADGLSNCQERIKDFVRQGYKRRILPLPGTVDIICGGPPCQGMSGFNRFREKENPFKDTKNMQMAVFMHIVEFLKPKFVLMENVVDILKFARGYLGRYALSQLVSLKYQARLGILAAGNYGLPQYRMRVFLWGAHPDQKLPQFPLPTHKVVTRGGPPVEFEAHVVAYDGSRQLHLETALRLSDAISDLPPVENDEDRDEMCYRGAPRTEFQHYIRLSQEEMMHPSSTVEKPAQNRKLFDHRPLQLNNDDYERVCRIPKHKGANFRALPGLVVGPDNVVEWDPNVERVMLPSGKPLIPSYAVSFKKGKSLKPFGRLWWDETVPTVVTRAQPHNQIIIHPEQDRVLSIRENARLQGFPDYYKLFGPVKERYIQVGNAVAVPVARALGYAFGMAYLGKVDEEPVLVLPQKFPITK